MNDWLKKLDGFFADLFLKKAPQLSENSRGWIIRLMPWLALIFGLMALPGVLAGLGLSTIGAPFWILAGGRHFGWLIGFLIGTAQVIIELMAVPDLFKKVKRGWQLIYWASLLGIISSLFYFSGTGLVMCAASIYFLYQVKSAYK